jgi:hypothetical protein
MPAGNLTGAHMLNAGRASCGIDTTGRCRPSAYARRLAASMSPRGSAPNVVRGVVSDRPEPLVDDSDVVVVLERLAVHRRSAVSINRWSISSDGTCSSGDQLALGAIERCDRAVIRWWVRQQCGLGNEVRGAIRLPVRETQHPPSTRGRRRLEGSVSNWIASAAGRATEMVDHAPTDQ